MLFSLDKHSFVLQKATTPEQIFTLSRIFFLVTVSRSPFIQSLVEEKRHGRTVVDIIAAKVDTTMVNILAGTKFARDAMTDLLKFAFNILLHYPKVPDVFLDIRTTAKLCFR